MAKLALIKQLKTPKCDLALFQANSSKLEANNANE
jgi:hypothetical protein